jgi:hypothetical protein
MNTKLKIALALGALAFSAQAAAQVTFYENESFRGRSFSTEQRVKDMKKSGLNDRASSVVVTGARWEVCSDRRYEGDCRVLRPGRYPSLASLGLNDRVSSARMVSPNTRIDDRRYAPAITVAHITFYEHEGYVGRSFTSDVQVDNFQRVGFNDLASSVDVVGERWEVCEDAGFSGRCVVLRPGRYPSVMAMGLNDKISSVRALASNSRVEDNHYAPRQGEQRDPGREYGRRYP